MRACRLIPCLAAAGILVVAPAPAAPAPPAKPLSSKAALVPLKSLEAYRSARRALATNLPGVAMDKALEILGSGVLSDADTMTLKLMLVEAAVRSGRAKELPAIQPAELPDSPAAHFWLAELLALAGRLAEAEQLLESAASDTDPAIRPFAALARSSILVALREPDAALAALQPAAAGNDPELAYRARLRQAELHLALQQPAEAASALAALPKAPGQRDEAAADYVRARLAQATDDASGALDGFQKVIDSPRGLPAPIVHACMIAAAKVRAATGDIDGSTDALIAFVNTYPDSLMLPAAFHAMEVAGVFTSPDRRADVETWGNSANPALASLAILHRARAEADEKPGASLKRLDAFLLAHPDAPQSIDVALRKAEILAAMGRHEEAGATLAALDTRPLTPAREALKSFLDAQLKRTTGNLGEAAASFLAATTKAGPDDAAAALYNAGLCSMLLDTSRGFEDAMAGLATGAPASPLGPRLLLERGLYLSAKETGTARLMLWRYLQAAPNDPERPRAYLVLAEIALRESPPQPHKAQNQLEKIPASAPRDILEKRDYLAVWAADHSGDPAATVEAANTFLARWPESPLADEIRFKTGATLAADGQHAAARSHFEIIAARTDSPWREQAYFQAGRSAALSLTDSALNDATGLFQKVVELKGPLRFLARQEQSRILFRQGNPDAAITLLKETLADKDTPPPEARRSLLFQQAEILLDRRGNDAAAATEAGTLFAALAQDPDSPVEWRNRAAWFLGRAALATDNPESALRTWFETIDASFPPGKPSVESHWAFRCGMSAIELLGRQQNWQAAAALAERLGQTDAPRAAEAKALHERIRLEHFLWNQPAPDPGGTNPTN